MAAKLRKPPSFLRKPRGARRILEVGAGHLPYEGVTHVVDKFPDVNEAGARSADLWVPPGVDFREGAFESLPFGEGERFDYFYARHVFEHVLDPVAAVAEINRVASRGYIETPSPVYEMLCCSFPFDPADVHTQFVWADPSSNTLHVVRKSARTISEFSSSRCGQRTRLLAEAKRKDPSRVPDRLLPSACKTTKLFFRGPLRLEVHESFEAALAQGQDAFQALERVFPFLKPPVSWVYPRFLPLREIWGAL